MISGSTRQHNKFMLLIYFLLHIAILVIMDTYYVAKCVRIHHLVLIVSIFVIARMKRVTTSLDVNSKYLLKVHFFVGLGKICALN